MEMGVRSSMGDKKKRVMILTSSHMIGGFETRSGIIIHGLDKERFEVTALLVYPLYKAKKTPEGIRRAQKKRLYWEGRGIKTVEIGMHNRYDVMAIVKTARIMRKLRIEILFFFALGSGTFLAPIAACCAGIPRIIRASGTVFEGLYPSVLRPLDRFLLHWTDMVVVPSQYLKALVRRKLHVPSGKLRIVPNGIDVRRFGNRSHRCGLKKELGLPASSRIVGIVANLIPVKDHAVLIRSAPRILESLPDVHFLLVGDGPLKDSLKLLSRQLDVEKHVQFL